MNKQELAATIWRSANDMRSKIDANEYKDYILGFIFYKFLSDKELNGLKADGWDEESLKEYLVETNEDLLKTCKDRYGYFIAYNDLFSTWLKKGTDFDASNVTTALSAFKRNVNKDHEKVFENIFDTLDTGLSKLGENSGARTKAISSLINLINPIPMDDKQGYDVLGYIYEYLISNFAANAGKKAGEFYTPHEVSLMMSQIVANHLKDRENIEIYDPTSGSGSLLINIGQSVSKYLKNKDKIKYYAQELKENTYSLTRMNLVMRGIKPGNIIARCGDTLADDWPYFEEGKKESTYEALFVDAVVSNPPYSQKWTPHEDARFDGYGIAPKSKADYAFLLHDLYHLNPDGIMTIVLPHGVLFRGGEEGQIRRNLIENDNIETIIGLPANIFFGTGIPTIVMVLKKKRASGDVLIIDASKGFVKEGKNNKLRACDIKKIVDTVVNRKTIDKYSRVVPKDEIRGNDYNLNIPRYVDSSDKAESYDIYATMFGGIPNSEIEEYVKYWQAFPSLKASLFKPLGENFSALAVEDVNNAISENGDVTAFDNGYKNKFADFRNYLKTLLVDGAETLDINRTEETISNDIFNRLKNVPLIDKYQAYQLLADAWTAISTDLEIIQTEGLSALNKVDPVMVIKKKGDKTEEVQDGWKGHIIPFELVQNELLKDKKEALAKKSDRLNEIASLYEEKLENLSEDDREEISDDLTDENDAFVNANVTKHAKAIRKERTPELSVAEKIVLEVSALIEEEKLLKKDVKVLESELADTTKKTIEALPTDKALTLVELKWIAPLVQKISELPETIIETLTKSIVSLSKKYETTLVDLDEQISETEKSLTAMLDELDGSEDDIKGLMELKKLLGGE
jgi:type I restriction-modification system, M subunit